MYIMYMCIDCFLEHVITWSVIRPKYTLPKKRRTIKNGNATILIEEEQDWDTLDRQKQVEHIVYRWMRSKKMTPHNRKLKLDDKNEKDEGHQHEKDKGILFIFVTGNIYTYYYVFVYVVFLHFCSTSTYISF